MDPPGSPGHFKLKLKLGAPSNPSVPPQPAAPAAHSDLSHLLNAVAPEEPPGYRQVTDTATVGVKEQVHEVRPSANAATTDVRAETAMSDYEQAVQSRDEANLALHRAQQVIVRLRQQKEALLDRVLELEAAAGLTSAEVDAAQQRAADSSAATLVDNPAMPSLQDRERKRPVLTTTTDLSKSSYNDPIDEPPAPTAFPPRQRSQHLLSAICAAKLREDADARRAATGLSKPAYPAVAVLGLEGSTVAENVERAMSGQALVAAPAPSTASGKRKRASSSTQPKASKAAPQMQASPPVAPQVDHLPNPFAANYATGSIPVPQVATPVESTPTIEPALQPPTVPPQHFAAVESPKVVDPYVPPIASTSSLPVDPHPHFSHAMYDNAMSPDGSVDSMGDDDDYYGGGGSDKRRKSDKFDDKTIKPKKMAKHGLSTGTYYIPHIVRNADGTPKLPMMAGIIQIRHLGYINTQDGFNTERYIFPVGFESSRKYPSMIQKNETVEYICRIANAGDGTPRFEIYPTDQPGVVISAGTPTGAWAQIVRDVNKLRERNHSNSVSGPDYYGISQNIVKAMIQELPNADEVTNYVWQNFVEETQAPPEAHLDGRKLITKRIQGPKRRFKDPLRAEQVAMKQAKQPSSRSRKTSHPPRESHPGDLRVMDSAFPNGHDESMYGTSEVGSSPGANSPAFSGREYTPSASLQNLMNPQPVANPYSIPVAPTIDPALSAGAAAPRSGVPFDPYALPPASGASAGISPQFSAAAPQAGANAWQSAAASFSTAGYPSFDIPTSNANGDAP